MRYHFHNLLDGLLALPIYGTAATYLALPSYGPKDREEFLFIHVKLMIGHLGKVSKKRLLTAEEAFALPLKMWHMHGQYQYYMELARKSRLSGSTLDLLNQNLYFNKIL